jgi:hypothetical protein
MVKKYGSCSQLEVLEKWQFHLPVGFFWRIFLKKQNLLIFKTWQLKVSLEPRFQEEEELMEVTATNTLHYAVESTFRLMPFKSSITCFAEVWQFDVIDEVVQSLVTPYFPPLGLFQSHKFQQTVPKYFEQKLCLCQFGRDFFHNKTCAGYERRTSSKGLNLLTFF